MGANPPVPESRGNANSETAYRRNKTGVLRRANGTPCQSATAIARKSTAHSSDNPILSRAAESTSRLASHVNCREIARLRTPFHSPMSRKTPANARTESGRFGPGGIRITRDYIPSPAGGHLRESSSSRPPILCLPIAYETITPLPI